MVFECEDSKGIFRMILYVQVYLVECKKVLLFLVSQINLSFFLGDTAFSDFTGTVNFTALIYFNDKDKNIFKTPTKCSIDGINIIWTLDILDSFIVQELAEELLQLLSFVNKFRAQQKFKEKKNFFHI